MINVTIGLENEKAKINPRWSHDPMNDGTYEYHSHALVSVLRSRDNVLRPLWEVFDAPMREYSSM